MKSPFCGVARRQDDDVSTPSRAKGWPTGARQQTGANQQRTFAESIPWVNGTAYLGTTCAKLWRPTGGANFRGRRISTRRSRALFQVIGWKRRCAFGPCRVPLLRPEAGNRQQRVKHGRF